MYQSLIPQTSATNQLYTNRRQFLRFLDRLHCLKMLWYEHVVQLLCFYPPTASFRALYEILFLSPKPELLPARPTIPTMLLTVAEHAEDWGILICLWLTCDWILLVKWLNLHASSTRKSRLFCSKFCLDTVNLLEVCSVSEKISALWAVLIFSNIEGSLGLSPQN